MKCIWGFCQHDAMVLVVTGKSCGHSSRPTPTCIEHLNTLLETSGVAPRSVKCDRCDHVEASRVVETLDLPT